MDYTIPCETDFDFFFPGLERPPDNCKLLILLSHSLTVTNLQKAAFNHEYHSIRSIGGRAKQATSTFRAPARTSICRLLSHGWSRHHVRHSPKDRIRHRPIYRLTARK